MSDSNRPQQYGQRLCRHFGECGGCAAQDVPYARQLALKTARLDALFAAHWTGPIPMHPSPAVWHYRNKIDPTFGFKHYPEPPPKGFPRETVLGFKRKGRWYWPIEVEECLIGPEGAGALLSAVAQWAREQELPPFNSRRGSGFLRHLLVREGKRTGERMAVLITSEGEFDRGSFVRTVTDIFPATSIQRAVNRGRAEVAHGDETEVLAGSAYIEEELQIATAPGQRTLRFRLSPFGFFQTNSLGTEVLYRLVREAVERWRPSVLFDLYGGSGGIGLACADLVRQVVSVESFPQASADGETNAALNGVSNIEFVTAPVEAYLGSVLRQGGFAEKALVVLDPPRAGLHPKALRRLIELRPAHLVYVSCNPPILAEELNTLASHYALAGLCGVDLFPHTPHVEAVACLDAFPS